MDPFVQNLIHYGLYFLAYLVVFGAVYLGRKANTYMTEKIGTEKMGQLRSGIETAVRALEQEGMLQRLEGYDKKAIAMNLARDLAEKLGIQVGEELLSFMIEEVVQIINTEAGKFTKYAEQS
jgi:hypothetical protein